MSVDPKVVEEKVAAGKELTAEETQHVLEGDGEAAEGYKPAIIESEETTVGVDDKPEDTSAADKNKAEQEKADKEALEKAERESKESEADPFVKIETELAKAEGKEDLSKFTEREKAYFHQMRRDRKSRQKAEEERDAAKFELIKAKKEAPEPKEEKPAVETPIEKLKKKDPTDFLTVAEVIELLGSQQAAPAAKETKEEKPAGIDPQTIQYLTLCDNEARSLHSEDYDAVIELTDEILNNNPEYLKEINKAVREGKNPAVRSYELIKADPEFAKLFPMAKVKAEAKKKAKTPDATKETKEEKPAAKTPEQLKKEEAARKAQEKLEANEKKPKTTAHVSTTDSSESQGDEYSIEEMAAMSTLEFARLPKAVRKKFLDTMKEI